MYYDIEIPIFDRPRIPLKKGASSEQEQKIDYSVEYEVIMKLNRKIGQKFVQLIHDYRFEKVNPANLEVPQLFYPQKLYNYLRNHHGEKGIPQDFASEWIRASSADPSLTEDDHMAFQMTLNKLDLPYVLPEFNTEVQKILIKVRSPEKKVEQVVQVGSDSIIIPPIDYFIEFRSWLLKKLDELGKN